MISRQVPTVFHPNRWRWLGLLLICLIFTSGGKWLLERGDWMGYVVGGFGILGSVVFVAMLLPRSSHLRVDQDGFEFCAIYRKCRYAWEDVTGFSVTFLNATALVGFNLSPDIERESRGRRLSRATAGFEYALPENYGQDAVELAKWLTAQREKYLERSDNTTARDFEGAPPVQ